MSAERRASETPPPELDHRDERGRGTLVALLDTIPEPIVVVGEDRRILYANDAVEHVFGYDRGELSERPVEALVREEDRRACLHAFGEVLDADAGGPTETDVDGLIAETAEGRTLGTARSLPNDAPSNPS